MDVFHGTATECHSLAIWDHTVLPATRHKWTHPALTPVMQAGTRFSYPGGMEGWVDLVDLIAPRPGVEPATFRSRVRRSTTAPPRKPQQEHNITKTKLTKLLITFLSFDGVTWRGGGASGRWAAPVSHWSAVHGGGGCTNNGIHDVAVHGLGLGTVTSTVKPS